MCFLSNVKPEVFTVVMRYIEQAIVSFDPIVVSFALRLFQLKLWDFVINQTSSLRNNFKHEQKKQKFNGHRVFII